MSAPIVLIRRATVMSLPQVYEFELADIREIEPQQEERWKGAIVGLLRQWTTNLGRMWFAEEDGKTVGYCFWLPVRGGKIRDPILREIGSATLASIYCQGCTERQLGHGRYCDPVRELPCAPRCLPRCPDQRQQARIHEVHHRIPGLGHRQGLQRPANAVSA
jgi:hypothetical protein